MARRMYDLDNGTEAIKVKKVVTNEIESLGFYANNDGVTFTYNVGFEDSLLLLPTYNSDNRPIGEEGTIIYDNNLKKCIIWNGTAWVNLDGTALS